ncbi:MAG: TetR/AcrR family transcriptional regulator [Chloroflexi bacterium]|nr:TetR/AcrR family transcriptional regulator [Chloroflexota bacterium]
MSTTRPATSDLPRERVRKLRRGPLTRKQIVDAALRLFSDKSFARTSVRDIAQAAGITDAAIYYHFPSKRDLFEAIIEERGFTAALVGLETAEVNVPPSEAIPHIARAALELMHANRDVMKILMVEAIAEDPVAAEEYRILVERWIRAEARILRFYERRGELRTDAVDALARQLVVAVIGAFADYLMMPQTDLPAPAEPPPELLRQVDEAMRRVVQGIT